MIQWGSFYNYKPVELAGRMKTNKKENSGQRFDISVGDSELAGRWRNTVELIFFLDIAIKLSVEITIWLLRLVLFWK